MNLTVMKDASEIIQFDIEYLPISIKRVWLSDYDNMQMFSHWHDEVELIKAIKGDLHYSVNGQTYCIPENDAIIINAKQMHYGYGNNGIDCQYLCIVFHPQLLCSNQVLKMKYIDPVLALSSGAVCRLRASNAEHQRIIVLMDEIYQHWQSKREGFELEVMGKLNGIWSRWFQLLEGSTASMGYLHDGDLDVQKRMLEFIYQHYDTKITLAQIAQAGEVCRSQCCKLFKKYLNKTPIGFLTMYRLEISTDLLRNTKLNITEIGLRCGFKSPSYFSETFIKAKGCTPTAFRRQNYGKNGL